MDVLKLIYDSIDEINEDLEEGEKVEKGEDTVIYADGSSLDSLGLVNLITIIEQKLEEETGEYITIADERALSMESSPFQTVKTLKDYIEILINE
tara:strand:+ start:15616 stop:15900 length:285 start_codon:yes stop_codon:yes gene_type:complete